MISRMVLGLSLIVALTGCGGSSKKADSMELAGGTDLAASPTLTLPTALVRPGTILEIPTDGRLQALTVETQDGSVLPGAIAEDGRRWIAARTAKLGAEYSVAATVEGTAGTQQLTGTFVTAGLGEDKRLTLAIEPQGGTNLGVGTPVAVRFDQAVQDRAAIERALQIRTSKPVAGSWHWVDAQQVRFRPEKYWPAQSRVRVNLLLDGVRAGPKLVGARDYESSFAIGRSRIARVDAKKHTLTTYVDGKRTATWATSLGQPRFATRSGTYAVLGKERQKRMTSCRANITCSRSSGDWYDLSVQYNVRLTWSGAFVHAAPWSAESQGRANVSHGCINLSLANAQTFFETAHFGDVVEVTGTKRTPADLIEAADPGMYDWNHDWPEYSAGSALGKPFVTAALAG